MEGKATVAPVVSDEDDPHVKWFRNDPLADARAEFAREECEFWDAHPEERRVYDAAMEESVDPREALISDTDWAAAAENDRLWWEGEREAARVLWQKDPVGAAVDAALRESCLALDWYSILGLVSHVHRVEEKARAQANQAAAAKKRQLNQRRSKSFHPPGDARKKPGRPVGRVSTATWFQHILDMASHDAKNYGMGVALKDEQKAVLRLVVARCDLRGFIDTAFSGCDPFTGTALVEAYREPSALPPDTFEEALAHFGVLRIAAAKVAFGELLAHVGRKPERIEFEMAAARVSRVRSKRATRQRQ